MAPRLSLVIPVFNERGNIHPLVLGFKNHRDPEAPCPYELVLVDNGSLDSSRLELEEAARGCRWIRILKLDRNQGYGGGIQAGLRVCSPEATHRGWMPADLQYSISDLQKIWSSVCKDPDTIHKGRRTDRHDGLASRTISSVYSQLTRWILGIPVADINGLPKIFPKTFFAGLNFSLASSFHLDGQLLLAAHLQGLGIKEHKVTFYARRAGVSSWSAKRLQVYRDTFQQLIRMRRESPSWYRSP